MAENINFRLSVTGGAASAATFNELAVAMDKVAASAVAVNTAFKTSGAKIAAGQQGLQAAIGKTTGTVQAGNKAQVRSEQQKAAQIIAAQRRLGVFLEKRRAAEAKAVQASEAAALAEQRRVAKSVVSAGRLASARQKAAEKELRAAEVKAGKIAVTEARAQDARLRREAAADKKAEAARLQRVTAAEAKLAQARVRATAQAAARIKAENLRIERQEAASIARRKAQYLSLANRLAGIQITLGAAAGRLGGSLGLLGPTFRRGLGETATLLRQAGSKGGENFVTGMVSSIGKGVGQVVKVVSDVVGSLIAVVGTILKSASASISALAFQAVSGISRLLIGINPLFASIVTVATATVGAVFNAFAGIAGGILQALGGIVEGVGAIMGSVVQVVTSSVARIGDLLFTVGKTIFSGVSKIVGGAVGAISDGLGAIFGTISGVLGRVAKTLFSPFTLIVSALAIKATADIRDRVIDAFALLDDRSAFHLDSMVQHLQRTSAAIGVSANELGTLLFDVISSGFRDITSVQEILQRSAELAVAGNAKVEDSGQAVITILKAYKLGAEEAAAAAKFLFDVQDRGRVTVQDTATSFAELAPVLISTRVPLEEAGAAFAALTITGESASEATTKLKRLILALAAASPDAADAMADLNVNLVEYSEQDKAVFEGLERTIKQEKLIKSALDKGSEAFERQGEKVALLERQLETFRRTRGTFVGLTESLRQIATAADEAGGSTIRLLREIIPRIRAASGGAFLVENLETDITGLATLIDRLREPSDKFAVAIEEAQKKVRVELTKTVTKLQEIGVALFDLGTALTGGRGFETVRGILDGIRNGVEDATEAVTRFRPRVLAVLDSIRSAFDPIFADGFIEGVQRIAAFLSGTLEAAFKGVIGAGQKAADAIFGDGATERAIKGVRSGIDGVRKDLLGLGAVRPPSLEVTVDTELVDEALAMLQQDRELQVELSAGSVLQGLDSISAGLGVVLSEIDEVDRELGRSREFDLDVDTRTVRDKISGVQEAIDAISGDVDLRVALESGQIDAAISGIRDGLEGVSGAVMGLGQELATLPSATGTAFRDAPIARMRDSVVRAGQAITSELVPALEDTRTKSIEAEAAVERIARAGTVSFQTLVGAVRQVSGVIAGSLDFSETALGKVFAIGKLQAQRFVVFVKGQFFDLGNAIRDTLASGFNSLSVLTSEGIGFVADFIGTVLKLLESALSKVSVATGGKGALWIFLHGGRAITDAIGGIRTGISEFLDETQVALRDSRDSVEKTAVDLAHFIGATFKASVPTIGLVDRLEAEYAQAKTTAETRGKELDQIIKEIETSDRGFRGLSLDLTPGQTFGDLTAIGDAASVLRDEKKAAAKEAFTAALKARAEISARLEEAKTIAERQLKVENELLTARSKYREELKAESAELASQLEGRVKELDLSIQTLNISEAASENERATARVAADARQREADILSAIATRHLPAIVRFEERRKDLIAALPGLNDKQRESLKDLLSDYELLGVSQLSSRDLLDQTAEIMAKLVLLAKEAGISVDDLASAFRRVANSASSLTGIGGLEPPKPGSAPAPSQESAGTRLLELINGNILEQTGEVTDSVRNLGERLGRGITGGIPSQQIPSTANRLQQLQLGDQFDRLVADIFTEFGRTIRGVGDFVGQQKFASGEGFIPLENIPLEAVRSVFDQIQTGVKDVGLSTDVLLRSVKEIRQFRASGELPGPRLGRPQGFEVGQNGKVLGVRPEAIDNPFVQRVLEGLAGRQAVRDMLTELGLSTKSLGAIEKILEEQAKAEKAAEKAAAAGAVDPTGRTGRRVSGPDVTSLRRSVSESEALRLTQENLAGKVSVTAEKIERLNEQLGQAVAANNRDAAQQAADDLLDAQRLQADQQGLLADAGRARASIEAGLLDTSTRAGRALEGISQTLETIASLREQFPGGTTEIGPDGKPRQLTDSEVIDRFDVPTDRNTRDLFRRQESGNLRKGDQELFDRLGAGPAGPASGTSEGGKDSKVKVEVKGFDPEVVAQLEKIGGELGKQIQKDIDKANVALKGAADETANLFTAVDANATVQEQSGEKIKTGANKVEAEIRTASGIVEAFAEETRGTFDATKDVLVLHEEKIDLLQIQVTAIRVAIAALAGGP